MFVASLDWRLFWEIGIQIQQAFGYYGHARMLGGASLGLCMCINILDDEYGSRG